MKRRIVRIDANLCNGCGKCVAACSEGAIEMCDGKAVLVEDSCCDGLGACIGGCPTGALRIEEREAGAFDGKAVEQRLEKALHASPEPCGCPSAAAARPDTGAEAAAAHACPSSLLSAWPVQVMLVPEEAPFLEGADILLAAECTPFAFADFHRRFLRGRVALAGCPKLDDPARHVEKLTRIFSVRDIRSVEVVYMQVPCCGGLVRIARSAREASGASFPLRPTRICLDGSIIESAWE